MKFNWISALILASALAILALIAFQVRWMRHSQQLLEEQFHQRVNMALCNTVEKLAGTEGCAALKSSGCSSIPTQTARRELDTLLHSSMFDETLREALRLYQIDLPYQAQIFSNASADDQADIPPFSCTLNPLLDNDDHFLQLNFDQSESYVLDRMGGMIGSSLFILLFICTIFIAATYHLLRQKRMSEFNREFFNHMAHEFRTPLTNIRLAGRMLGKKDEGLNDSPYLKIINEEGNHLMEQVEQVLQLARLERGDFQLDRRMTDVHQLLGDTVRRMNLRQAECRADIRLDLPPSPLYYPLDPLHFGNAVSNLLDNALKYCPTNPEIDLKLRLTEQGLHLSLKDNGPGWAEEDGARVFEKFYQPQHPSVRKGFGLGLPYVKRVIEMHNGSIRVNSRPQQGTQFDLFIPRQTKRA